MIEPGAKSPAFSMTTEPELDPGWLDTRIAPMLFTVGAGVPEHAISCPEPPLTRMLPFETSSPARSLESSATIRAAPTRSHVTAAAVDGSAARAPHASATTTATAFGGAERESMGSTYLCGLVRDERHRVANREGDLLVAERLQAGQQRPRLDRVVDVVLVEVVQLDARQAVGADQHAAGAQDTQHLGEQPVLQRRGRQMVQHRERARRVERVGGERKRRGVAADDLDVRVREALRQPRGGLGLDLHRDQALDAVPKPVGA